MEKVRGGNLKLRMKKHDKDTIKKYNNQNFYKIFLKGEKIL